MENGIKASFVSCERARVAKSEWAVCKVHLASQNRTNDVEPDRRIGVFLRVKFAEPVAIPFPSFGHSCHFGLGQFKPDDESM